MRVKNLKKNKLVIALLVMILSYIPLKLNAQDFDVTVIMDMQTLSNDVKDKLKDFKQQVEDYYNKNKFANGDIYKIKATIQFSFNGSNGFDNYDTKMFVASQRIIDKADKKTNPRYSTLFRILDERCTFTYNRSMPFIYSSVRFDSFLSLLDYYAFMMLGYDADSYFPARLFPQQCGTQYFQKAQDICNKPMSDRNGWTETGGGSKPSRLQLVQEILNPKFMDFRTAIFEYHWRGLDSLGLSKNSYDYILNALDKMVKIKKTEPKTYNIDLFFEAKNQEIADTFLDYGNKKIYDKIILIDPSHQRIYEEAKSRAH